MKQIKKKIDKKNDNIKNDNIKNEHVAKVSIKPKKIKVNKIKEFESKSEENREVFRFAKILIILCVLGVGIYLFTGTFITKELFQKKAEKEATEITFDYSTTIMGSVFNRPYEEYYVLIFATSSEKAAVLNSALSNYSNLENAKKIYYVDLDLGINKKYYDVNNVNKKAMDASELRVGDYTLLKIKNKKITKYIENVDSILKELAE